MDAIQRILIPTDFTPGTDRAVQYGVYLARQFGAEVHLLHVVEGVQDDGGPGYPSLKKEYRLLCEVASRALHTVLSDEQKHGLVVQEVVFKGSSAPVIVDYIARQGIDLTVMGTHGRQGTERFLIGSTAERVVRFAHSSVLTVGPRGEQTPECIRRMLVPVDFSDQARRAVRYAHDLAVRLAARLEVLHVIEPLPPIFYSDNPLVLGHHVARIEREACELLQAFVEETVEPGVPVTYHAVKGRPANEIAAFAKRRGLDLIVQCSLGFTDEEELMLGSVAEEVVRLAPCPVFTAKGVTEAALVEPTFGMEEPADAVRPDSKPLVERGELRIERILHPTDFSACAKAALPCALNLARRSHARLHLLHVTPTFGDDPIRGAFQVDVDDVAFYRRLRDEAARQMQAMLGAYDHEGVHIEQVHAQGQAPSEIITEYAEAEDIDVVVIGTHGRRGVKRLLLGSIAQEVIQDAGCAVLAVHGRDQETRSTCSIRRILAPVDFSVHSIEALTYAKGLAALFEASLDVLHVLDPTLNARLFSTGLKKRSQAEREEAEKARERLEWLTQEVSGPLGLFVTYPVVTGYPPEEIVRHAAQQGCDLIVMATHGLTGLKGFPLGSVTERVLQAASCPVFITKPFGKSLLASPADATREASEEPSAHLVS